MPFSLETPAKSKPESPFLLYKTTYFCKSWRTNRLKWLPRDRGKIHSRERLSRWKFNWKIPSQMGCRIPKSLKGSVFARIFFIYLFLHLLLTNFTTFLDLYPTSVRKTLCSANQSIVRSFWGGNRHEDLANYCKGKLGNYFFTKGLLLIHVCLDMQLSGNVLLDEREKKCIFTINKTRTKNSIFHILCLKFAFLRCLLTWKGRGGL